MSRLMKEQQQQDVSQQRRLATNNVNAESVQSISGETLQFEYYNSGVLTTDAGQAAGTLVIGKMANSNILTAEGDVMGSFKNTSFSFDTGTILTTAKAFNYKKAELEDMNTGEARALAVTSGFANGEYTIDHETGMVYGIKATTGTSDTINYKIFQSLTGGGGGIAADVNVSQIGGTNVNLDDSAFAVGVDAVLPTGFLADETATDSVDEGDTGIARITLDRKQITASEFPEDSVHSSGDYGTQILAVRNDSGGALGADGDYTPLQTDSNGRLITNAGSTAGVSSIFSANVTHTNPQDFSVAFTSNVTVTVSGAPFTVDDANCRIAWIMYQPSGGNWQSPLVNGVDGVSLTASSNVITVAGAGTPFASGDTYAVGISYQNKGYTLTTNSNRSEEIDPLDEHYLEEELIDTTNVAAATNYYPSSDGQPFGNYNNVSIHGETSGGVTFTVEVKIDDSTDWVDITRAGYRLDDNTTGNASLVDQSFIMDFDDLHVRHIRIKSVTADATNGVQYHWKFTAI